MSNAGEPYEITLAGELDLDSLDDMRAAVQAFRRSDATDARVVMTDVTFIDSSALSTLLRLRATAEERGGRVLLVDVPEVALRVLEITSMDRIFDIES